MLPAGTTVYSKRPIAGGADALMAWLPRELNIIERAIRDTVVRGHRTVTAAVTVTLDDSVVLGDATGAAFAVTLPSAAAGNGRTFVVKKVDASGNAVTVTAAGSDLIDGAGTFPLAAQYDVVTVFSTGTAWMVLG